MMAYFGAIWRCRYFWLSLVRMDLRTRYRGSVLGIGWSLLHPIFMTIILCVVFGRLFAADLRTFAPFLMAGLTFWSFLSAMTVQGCHCFFSGEAYIRQYPAPLAIYPLRTALASGFHFLLALMLVIVLGGVMHHGYSSIWPLLSLVPTCGLLLIMGWSLAVLFGLANVRFRDTSYLCEVLLQIVFYMTPVMYPPKLLNDKNVGWLVDINPLVPFLNLLRDPVEKNTVPSLTTVLAAICVTALLALTASLALRSQERRLIFHL